METVKYPFTPGSGLRNINWAQLFDFHNSDAHAKPQNFGTGNGGQFTLEPGEKAGPFDTAGIPVGKYATLTLSRTYTPAAKATVTVNVDGKSYEVGPGETAPVKIRKGSTVLLSSASGGVFCVQSQHS